MTITTAAFGVLPSGLRAELLKEYESIVQHYLERRWSPAELSGGRFCEIVFSIIDGFGVGSYPSRASKPPNMVSACKTLESRTGVPRSFQILIPRLLPALYEVRNNRGVGHVGGDVDSNQMDATAVLGLANWIMAELVRVLHSESVNDAQAIVDSLAQRRIPLVWERGQVKRVLDPKIKLQDQVLLLLSSCPTQVQVEDLLSWTGYKDRAYFLRTLRKLRDGRLIELDTVESEVHLLPPGTLHVETLVRSYGVEKNLTKTSKRSSRRRRKRG